MVTLVEIERNPTRDFKKYEIRRVLSDGTKMLWTTTMIEKAAFREAAKEARKWGVKVFYVNKRITYRTN